MRKQCVHGVEAVPSCPNNWGLGCRHGSLLTIVLLILSCNVGHTIVTVTTPDHAFLFLYNHNANKGGLGWATRNVGEDVANNDTGGGQQGGWGTTNKKQQPIIDGSSAMMEDDGAGGGQQERAEGNRVDK